MRLIDTNAVISAAGKAHPLQDEARKVLDRIAEGYLHANVDVELLQEILHVYAARKELAARHGFALTGVAADMQATWRARQLDPVEHVPIESAEQPFARFDERTRP